MSFIYLAYLALFCLPLAQPSSLEECTIVELNKHEVILENTGVIKIIWQNLDEESANFSYLGNKFVHGTCFDSVHVQATLQLKKFEHDENQIAIEYKFIESEKCTSSQGCFGFIFFDQVEGLPVFSSLSRNSWND